ncbi:hypothetical protein KBZ14_06220 [Synechococcus sp. HJ21-Hayes]|uniref:hypothetical protein n=1 Tax=unclassified Synechococcus TaxID=2626047 RepID=UPI0020CB9358|nr:MULTISPECIES: hypothetical protein [unclassified Synechococcus]MCP9831024.1 hypothetical protein [Synechococcus sp. JJ3a-Johnson]MCP9852466.1 hypothetical protein [Synechococcus sp. HJ21-Hayes]
MDALEKHFNQWKQISNRLQGQLGSVLEAQRALEKAVCPTLELQKVLKSPLEPFLEEQRRLQKAFEGIKLPTRNLPDLSPFAKQIQQYQKSLGGIISPAFTELQRSFKELPPKIQEALLLLAQHGWYLDFNMPLPSLLEIKKAISSGEIEEVEEALVEYFESQLDEVEKSFDARFPHRSHIISSAIKAHRNGEYFLSIPVLLAQTDGICKEVVDQYLFMKKGRKPRTAIYVEQVAADTYKAALLSPLAASTPISASVDEREEGFNLLNRHMVLHGESLDYGSKVNGLKALSLINYVSQALEIDAGYP